MRLTRKNIYGRDEVPVTVNYDLAMNTITVNPRQPLSSDTTYTLSLLSIQNALGHTLPSTTLTFKTQAASLLLLQWRNYHPAGDIASYGSVSYNANGKLVKSILFNTAGLDGVWFSADDEANDYYVNSYDANGNKA